MAYAKSFLIIFFAIFSSMYCYNNNIMTYEEYAELGSYPRPCMYRCSYEKQQLFYFGANHSSDPYDSQYPLLEDYWRQFLEQTKAENCVVLVEGAKRPVRATKKEAIKTAGGEGGFITFLADQKNIPVECPEPKQSEVLSILKDEFTQEELMYKYFAQHVLQYNRHKKGTPGTVFTEYIQGALSFLQRLFGVRATLADMKRIHRAIFATDFNPDDEAFFYAITNPVVQDTVISKICRKTSIIRDQTIVQHIKSLLNQGKSVFVVYGYTHAVMQQPAFFNKAF